MVADLCPSFSGCNEGRLLSSVFKGVIVPTEMFFVGAQLLWPAPHSQINGTCIAKCLLNTTFTNDIFFWDSARGEEVAWFKTTGVKHDCYCLPTYKHQMPSLSHSQLPRWHLTNKTCCPPGVMIITKVKRKENFRGQERGMSVHLLLWSCCRRTDGK